MNWKFLPFILALCIAPLFVAAQEVTEAPAKAPTAENQLPNALLWEVSGKGLAQPSYVYGTIHLINQSDFFWPKGTIEAFKNAERITFELDLEEMYNISTMMTMLMNTYMPNGLTLQKLLSKEDYALVVHKLDEVGMGSMMFILDRVKPMFLTMLVGSGDMVQPQMESGEITSYEMEFLEKAQAVEKEIEGLESFEFQMSIFDSIPYKEQADMLVEALKTDGASAGMDLDALGKLYKTQDIEAMANSFDEEEEGLAKYEKILLENRNKNWIPKMEGQMSEKVTFFAVGAGHLGGEDGVIKLLKEAGYTVKPLSVE